MRAEGADPPLDFAIEEMLREAAYTGDIAAVEAVLGPLDQPLEAVADPMGVSQTILTPSEGYLLSRLDGRLTAQAALDLVPIDADAARRSLFGLLVSGLVRFGKAEPSAPPRRARGELTPPRIAQGAASHRGRRSARGPARVDPRS